MISIQEACCIATKKMKNFKMLQCIDIGDKFAFSFGLEKQTTPPGTPIVCVNKTNGEVTYITIPPIENINILNNGKVLKI